MISDYTIKSDIYMNKYINISHNRQPTAPSQLCVSTSCEWLDWNALTVTQPLYIHDDIMYSTMSSCLVYTSAWGIHTMCMSSNVCKGESS